jgi:hypothetical protein
MEFALKSAASALIAYTAHYASTKFYSYACVPNGWTGYLTGLITTGSPVCQVGVQMITSTQTSYSSMILMGISRFLVDLLAPGSK